MKTVLFDLDGTLLPLDQDKFLAGYFTALAGFFAKRGHDPQPIMRAVKSGVGAMLTNDGTRTNEQAYWSVFIPLCGDLRADFDEYYETDFMSLKAQCGCNPEAAKAVDMLKASGARLVLASNPLFPLSVQKKRMVWAGIDPDNFAYITAYENSSYCKPNLGYYTEIVSKIGAECGDCVMVGNDVDEDMIAQKTGMGVFLLTDCLLNRNNADISAYAHGGYEQLLQMLK